MESSSGIDWRECEASSFASRARLACTRRRALATLGATTLAVALNAVEGGCAAFNAFKSVDVGAATRAAENATRDASRELERLSALHTDRKLSVCFIGVAGGAEASSLSDATRERLGEVKGIKLFDKSTVQEALKESGVRANNVFIPTERAKFVDALGEPVDYLLAGYVEDVDLEETAETKGKTQRAYKLELVELETNKKCEFLANL